MSESHNEAELDPFAYLFLIYSLANERAAQYAQNHQMRFTNSSERLIQAGQIPDKTAARYTLAADSLASELLSDRQRKIASRVAALVVTNPGIRTFNDLKDECQARRHTVGAAIAVLTGVANQYLPVQDTLPSEPLLYEIRRQANETSIVYGPSAALRWLVEQDDQIIPQQLQEALEWAGRVNDNS